MKGIRYLVDDSGKKTALVLDLDEWGEFWEALNSRFSQVGPIVTEEVKNNTAKHKTSPPYHDLDYLIGTWSEEDAKAFTESVAPFAQIDEDLWRD